MELLSGSRRLLKRLRDVMAGVGSAQERLDKLVRIIAIEMRADVCSIYILRSGDVLELFSTIGLNPGAVHKTRLRLGEGIIGDIADHARPMALANAPSHPSFVYRPETGEDPYHGMLGVPILRGGAVRGVLAIQNRDRRNYAEEEVEILETVAMVVAEVVVAADVTTPQFVSSIGADITMPAKLQGTGFNAGLAQGLAVLHQPQITIREMLAEDPAEEIVRLSNAVSAMHAQLDEFLAVAEPGEQREILETYRMLSEDRSWLGRIREAIHAGLSAEAAVARVQNDTRVRMSQISDPYLKERLHDLEDLTNRLLSHLSGRRQAGQDDPMPEAFILIARNLGPAELLEYDRRHLRGIILEEGAPTSHVAIVARALDIPLVGQCADALSRIQPLDPVVLDGGSGVVLARPPDDVQETVTRTVALRSQRQLLYRGVRNLPSITQDGIRISINLNAGLLIDLPQIADTGSDGVGLYRTEIPFMVRDRYPDLQAQEELYAKIYEQANGKPVVFRTLDVGGDKMLPYFAHGNEENPAMGWRALRIGLDRPALLRQQIRAMLRASHGRPLSIMFPLVSCIDELVQARRMLALECAQLARDGKAQPERIDVGVMLEVPALLWQLPALMPLVDFLSVGTNDLAQYMFAADRGNAMVNKRYDTLAPGFLAALCGIFDAAEKAGKPVSVCGEMAGRPLEAMALLAIGCRRLSMSAPMVGAVKTMLCSLSVAPLAELVRRHMNGAMPSLRPLLLAYARDHDIVLDESGLTA